MTTYFDETPEQTILRLGYAAEDISRGRPRRVSYADSAEKIEADRLSRPMAAESRLTHSDIDAAMLELADERGEDVADTHAQVMALTGGEKDVASLAEGIMALSAMDGDTVSLAYISEAERTAAAKRGHALPDKSYPVRNVKELRAAAVLAASGHGDVPAAKKLIRKRARELGVDVESLPGFSGSEEDNDRAAATHAAMEALQLTSGEVVALAAGDEDIAGRVELAAARAGESDAERKIRSTITRTSNADLFREKPRGRRRGAIHVHDMHGEVPEGAEHPTNQVITTATRAHSSRNHSVDLSGFGGAGDIMARHPELFGQEKASDSGNRRTPPKGLAHGRHQSKIKEQ